MTPDTGAIKKPADRNFLPVFKLNFMFFYINS